MPYSIVKGGGCSGAKPYAVVKTGTGERMGCHESEEKAKGQQAALYASEKMNTAIRRGR